MDLGLGGKVALVAAASRGLGRAAAQELAREGAAVVICARNAEALEQARREMAGATCAEIHAVVADVAEREGIEHVTTEAMRRFGRVDVLVTNAGGPPAGMFDTHQWDAWQRAVDLTLRSVVELTRAVLPGMKERKWGRIISINSIAAKQPVDNLMLSNSVRAAITGFLRTLATEVAVRGITVNSILPGYTLTERIDELATATAARDGVPPSEVLARIANEIPMRRLGDPSELGALTAFLASERAAYITAQAIAVDGGWIRALM